MKKYSFIHIFLLYLLFFGGNNEMVSPLQAQTSNESENYGFFEGVVTYEVKPTNMDSAQQKMYDISKALGISLDSKMTRYYKGDTVLTIVESGISNHFSLENTKTNTEFIGKIVSIKSGQIEKYIYTDTYEDGNYEPEITFLGETKTILNHKCKKAHVYSSFGSEMDVYYSTAFKPIRSDSTSSAPWHELKGFPLQIIMKTVGESSEITAISIEEKKLPESMFELPTDFKKITKEEFEAMMNNR